MYKQNVCGLIIKVKLIILPFYSHFSNFLCFHIHFSAGGEIIIMLNNQFDRKTFKYFFPTTSCKTFD